MLEAGAIEHGIAAVGDERASKSVLIRRIAAMEGANLETDFGGRNELLDTLAGRGHQATMKR